MGWFRRSAPESSDARRPAQKPELPAHRKRLSVADAHADEIRNLAMALVLMWGPSRRLPAAQRLCHFVRGLDQASAAAMVADGRAAEEIAGGHVYEHSDYTGARVEFPPRSEVDALVLARFPWVDDENLGHVYSQSCYHAWHG